MSREKWENEEKKTMHMGNHKEHRYIQGKHMWAAKGKSNTRKEKTSKMFVSDGDIPRSPPNIFSTPLLGIQCIQFLLK